MMTVCGVCTQIFESRYYFKLHAATNHRERTVESIGSYELSMSQIRELGMVSGPTVEVNVHNSDSESDSESGNIAIKREPIDID